MSKIEIKAKDEGESLAKFECQEMIENHEKSEMEVEDQDKSEVKVEARVKRRMR